MTLYSRSAASFAICNLLGNGGMADKFLLFHCKFYENLRFYESFFVLLLRFYEILRKSCGKTLIEIGGELFRVYPQINLATC